LLLLFFFVLSLVINIYKYKKYMIIVAQLSQSNYNALQTPYCLFGLGRTNSYIEELFVGVSRRNVCNSI